MVLKPIVGEINSQDLNDNFSYLNERIVEGAQDPRVDDLIADLNAHKAEDMTQKTVHGLRYEEGSWTPTLFGQTVAGSHTYANQEGRYIRIGKKITLYGYVRLSAKDPNMAGNVRIGGLPFVAGATVVGSVSFGFIANLDFAEDEKMLVGYATSNRIDLTFVRDDATQSVLQPSQIKNNTVFIFTADYYIN